MQQVTTHDDYVLSVLNQASGMIRNIARRYNAEFDDLQQEAALLAIQILSTKTLLGDGRAYLQRAIQHRLIWRLQRRPSVVSIDEPLYDDGKLSGGNYADRVNHHRDSGKIARE